MMMKPTCKNLLLLKLTLALLLALAGWQRWTMHTAYAQGPCFVETTGDNSTDFDSTDASAVQMALNALQPSSDTIKIAGNCVGVQPQGGITQTMFISQSLTIQGGYTHTNWLAVSSPKTLTTTLDANRNGRIAYITGTVDVTLDGLTITGGDGGQSGGTPSDAVRNYGGAIYLETGNVLTISNSIVYSNTVVGSNNYGGALYLEETTRTVITNSTFDENYTPTGQGGAIKMASISNTLQIYNSTFSNNGSGSNQGGVLYMGGTVAIENSTFEGNYSASNQGGVLYMSSFGSPLLTITNSIFRNNWSGTQQGGALYLGGAASVISSTFEGNYSGSSGGVIYSGGELSISHSHFEGNYADESGSSGGVVWASQNTTIAETTFISNSATSKGGALYFNSNQLTMSNTTFISNSAEYGGGFFNNSKDGATLQNVTLSANTAITSGGGIYNDDGNARLTLQNVTLSTNRVISAGGGAGLYNSGGLNLSQQHHCQQQQWSRLSLHRCH